MAIPCAACGQPVNEHVVICPHCAGPTGVAPDKHMTYEERVAQIELDRVKAESARPPSLFAPQINSIYPVNDPELVLIGGAAAAVVAVGAVVKSAVEAVVHEREDRPEIPRAIAHERKSQPHLVVPEPSREPDPAPPPSDKPRFLK